MKRTGIALFGWIEWMGGLGCAGLVAGLLWSYWPTLTTMSARWSSDPQYSHGYMVPVFAAALLWVRRKNLTGASLQFSWWGVGWIVGAAVLRLAADYVYLPWLETVSLIPALLGCFVLVGGKRALNWAWPSVTYLLFMIPLPYRLGGALAPSLQRFATLASTYTLETIGFPAIAEGNIILLNDAKIGVVEACSGLSMLIIFFAMTTAVAILIQRPVWEKVISVFSALPIALIANIARITLTGVLSEVAGGRTADRFHDWAGWLMMPLALVMLGIELRLIKRLVVERTTPQRMSVAESRPGMLPALRMPTATRKQRKARALVSPSIRNR